MKQIWLHLKEKWIRYLFEMIAVILGILGAFTLDNWGQDRKDRREEILILQEISDDLTAGLMGIKRTIDSDLITQNAIKIIIHHMANDLPYHDSLNRYFYNLHAAHVPEFPSSGFETLKSKGFGLISNTELRRHLINIFGLKLILMKESLLHDAQIRHEKYTTSTYIENFSIQSPDLGDDVTDNPIETIGTNSVAVPVDYDGLVGDQSYENLIREMYNNSVWMIKYKQDVSNDMQGLKDKIEVEISRLQRQRDQ